MVELIDAYSNDEAPQVLWELLSERTPEQSINHKQMPSMRGHLAFFDSKPYPHWYLIRGAASQKWVGATYLTDRREIGIFIFRSCSGKGYGKQAVRKLLQLHPGAALANVNPENHASILFFRSIGAKHIQTTFSL